MSDSSAGVPLRLVSNGTVWIPASGKVGAPVESLYVHVPFCAHKCEYCAFYSGPASGDVIQRYVQALLRELELIAQDCRPKTIFFGGGTPSLLNLKQWESVLTTLHRLGLANAPEFSVECNPATVSADKAALLRQFGVNRISMGVQSLDESLLDRLGRVHSRDMVFRSYDILRKAGFENINIDLMFAIPGQTLDIWNRTLDEALALGTEHLSCYEVIYEEDTPLYEQLKANAMSMMTLRPTSTKCFTIGWRRLVLVLTKLPISLVVAVSVSRRIGLSLNRVFQHLPVSTMSATGADATVTDLAPAPASGCGDCAHAIGPIRFSTASSWKKVVVPRSSPRRCRPSRGLAKWLPLAFG